MAVAKSYMNMPQLCEPYKLNGKMYVKVDTGKGEKQVRYYTDAQFAKMYPEAIIVSDHKDDPYYKPQKETLGFSKGYITIFRGDTARYQEWLISSVCRHTRWWGWYVASCDEIPADLPKDLIPVRLDWDPMSSDGENLIKNEDKIREYVESVQFGESNSEFIGTIKERLSLTLTVKKVLVLENNYGYSIMHTFEDEKGNVFIWTTSVKTLQKEKVYKLRGTVKEHKIYRGVKQTILTRCTNIEEI